MLPNCEIRYPMCITIKVFSLIFHFEEETSYLKKKTITEVVKKKILLFTAVSFFLFIHIVFSSTQRNNF